MKQLTIWIPTFRRLDQVEALLVNIGKCGLAAFADIIVSDNDPGGSFHNLFGNLDFPHAAGVGYRRNPANLSAGANFLRAFEYCRTPWLMIVGDDDRFDHAVICQLCDLINELPASTFAVKFDSSLFGRQQPCSVNCLQDYVDLLNRSQYPDAFNNLCLISNWLFRREPYLVHLSSAYLGYSSKLSHLFPVLRACALQGGQIEFLSLQPVIHGKADDSSWPKAATWYEMVMTLSTFSGFVNRSDRQAFLRLLFHTDWRRNLAKCLRVHQFYGNGSQGIQAWQIHGQLALLSPGYCLAVLLALPILLLPGGRLPRRLAKKLGDPGCVERW